MKAIVYTQYGPPDVLRLTEIAKPSPKDEEVLITVHAASANAADWHLLRGDPFLIRLAYGLRRPKNTILGADIAGRVEAVGSKVTRFKPGDEVFGDLSGCGFGGFAEYACARENALALKPTNTTFENAAAAPMAAVTALQALRDKGQLQPKQKVLINGASGGVGTFAVQLARHFGAEVTAVCSTGKVDMARSLGADHVVDYTQEDFTRSGRRYDLIVGANGYHSLSDYKRALLPNGRYVSTGGAIGQSFEALLLGPLFSMIGSNKMSSLLAQPSSADLDCIRQLIEAGSIVAVIDRCYPLDQVPEALRYLEQGHARGKVSSRCGVTKRELCQLPRAKAPGLAPQPERSAPDWTP